MRCSAWGGHLYRRPRRWHQEMERFHWWLWDLPTCKCIYRPHTQHLHCGVEHVGLHWQQFKCRNRWMETVFRLSSCHKRGKEALNKYMNLSRLHAAHHDAVLPQDSSPAFLHVYIQLLILHALIKTPPFLPLPITLSTMERLNTWNPFFMPLTNLDAVVIFDLETGAVKTKGFAAHKGEITCMLPGQWFVFQNLHVLKYHTLFFKRVLL